MLTAIPRYGARVLPNTIQVISAVDEAGQLVDGPHIEKFEAAFARRLGAPGAVSTSFARMACYYTMKALDLPPGGEVVVPALTFWVIPEIIRVAGFRPVFADVDPETGLMTAESAARVVGPKTVAIVPTHLWGLPCNMDAIMDLARAHKLVIIEDCAHALDAAFRGQPVGTFGDAAFFSFQTLKPLNTYGGGMAVARDANLLERIAALAADAPPPTEKTIRKKLWHGRVQRISIRPRVFTWTLFPVLWSSAYLNMTPDVFLWEKIRSLDPLPPGYHERYSNVQAALGLEALKYLDRWTATTRAHAAEITRYLAGLPGVRLPSVPPDRTHVFYQYCATVPNREATVRRCLKRGVDLETLHVDICTRLPLFEPFAVRAPGAEATARAVQIPVYESLTDEEIARIGSTVRDAIAVSEQTSASGAPERNAVR